MTTKIEYVCDRCHKTCSSAMDREPVQTRTRTRDLCLECYQKFLDFMDYKE